jgi:two-component system OmpR family sensor kinase
MSRPRSLRRDLALGLGGGVVVLWLLAMAGSWVVLRGEVNEIYDAVLKQAAERILQLPSLPATQATPRVAPQRNEDMSFMLRRPDGMILMQSDGADPAVFGDAPRQGFREQGDHRIFGLLAADDTFLEVADPLEERRSATREALTSLLVPAAALAPLIFFGVAWFLATRLRPVALLADQVAQRDSGDLRPLSTPGLQLELIPIRDAVNRLMGRLADAMATERAFSANAAHELRTPIAATLAQTQRLIAQAPEGPLRDRAQAIEAELKRMARLSEKLLDLARAEAAGVTSGSGQDLRPLLSLVAEDFRAAPDLRVTLPPDPVTAAIDPDAFAILARNLIENAVLHGLPPVEVSLGPDGALRVSNGGTTLAPESLARLTRRFERLGSRREGSGLGLAIVEALARNAHAKLEFHSPAPGRPDGLSAVVMLPTARPETS